MLRRLLAWGFLAIVVAVAARMAPDVARYFKIREM
jgi:hypothetical protein